MTLSPTKSKVLHICVTGIPESQISLRFALRTVFETQAILRQVYRNDLEPTKSNVPHICISSIPNPLSSSNTDLAVVEQPLRTASETAIELFRNCSIQANTVKFQLALFSRNSGVSQLSLPVQGIVPHSQELAKLLGVLIDRGLCFNEHVSCLCYKAAGQLNSLSRLSSVLPVESKYCIYTWNETE